MNDHYNIFGNYVASRNIETFDDEVSYTDKIDELSKQIKTGDIKEEELKEEILKLKKIFDDGKLSESDEIAFKKMMKKNVRLTDGINLVGNLELGGIIKARGFHLADGTEVKTITQHKDKLAVPLDKDGNVHIKPNPGKKMKIDKTDVKELNIPKSGKITFGAGEDNDPYHLKKFGDKDNNHLRLTLNDNANESLQVWGNSCKTDKCNPDGGSVAHILDSNGNVVHHGSLQVKNSKNTNNPTGYATHFNYKKEGKNYIRGNTQVDGKLCVKEPGKKKPICLDSNLLGSSKTMNVKGNANVTGDIVFNGGNNWIMHTPDDKRHTLYIAPSKTKGKGDWNWANQTRFLPNGEVILNNGKHNTYNRTGWPTHFNNRGIGLNYIRGQTELRGEVNFVDKDRGINIHQKRTGHNPNGWGTHFNHGGQGRHYIRGRTEIRGPTIDLMPDRGINVHSKGRVSTFGSQSSSWCHIVTNAPSGFYFNNGIQVNGVIRGYPNKPIHADKGIRIGNINLYEKGGRLFIDAPVTINNRQSTHGSLNIMRTGGDNSDWNYIQFLNKRGQRTAWGGSKPGRRFGSGR